VENVTVTWAQVSDLTRLIAVDLISHPSCTLSRRPREHRNHPTEHRPAVIVRASRVLLLLVHRRISKAKLSWQFPAGEVEVGETPQQAAERETREETGLDVQASSVIGERVHAAHWHSAQHTCCRGGRLRRVRQAPGRQCALAAVSW
jgi:8-oxo-dGTP pyrophosphatase MutT (NUDIX family)